ncbi:efflux RND transporter periplasmic adaptor subunit [Rhodoplanes serenus]|uniref:Efflux RND transporter periplasmic adaptor subunit n=1 Tax=Rhodoplanes serenus TaxID=200615 RepID=A0A9X5ATI6_9BRAD|nr:efflux RND transporter periplasmic adaptor subunit [Rhodoplanes serenus]MTW18421.1 efflux RND transporter periplasmic adaptor subunit [Rhodoplanes serenus]
MTEVRLVPGGAPARFAWQWRIGGVALLLAVAAGAGATWRVTSHPMGSGAAVVPGVVASLQRTGFYRPKDAEWATLTVQPVAERAFRSQHVTEGKIQIDEDRTTPIFSPYAGRVTRIDVRIGDAVTPGRTLFVVEANDMVQAQNAHVAAVTGLAKAHAALDFARIADRRSRDLVEARAAPLKEAQQAQATLAAALGDLRAAETARDVARDRLRLLGADDAAVARLEAEGRIDPEMAVRAPLSGVVMQRRIGPGQYITAGASEPVLVIGDLATVRLCAYVRETEAGKIRVGQPLSFTVPAHPDRVFTGRIDYVAAEIDGVSRRLLVRADIDNADGLLKPEMLASVTIATNGIVLAAGVPQDAVIIEGHGARVWVARDDRTLELRPVTVGAVDQRMVQIVEGLAPGERVVTGGGLLIDRIASGR